MAGVKRDLNLRTDAEPLQLLKEVARSPLIYIRLLGIICSIVVFSCIADQVQSDFPYYYTHKQACYYYAYNSYDSPRTQDACNFAIVIGVIGFLLCLAFLVRDVLYVVIDSVAIKKVIVLVDAVTNGLWTFMWFVAFVFTADGLRNSSHYYTHHHGVLNCARAVVAFSFFCVLIWIAIVVVNVIIFIRIWKGINVCVVNISIRLWKDTDSSSRGQIAYAPLPTALREEEDQDNEDLLRP